MENKNTYFGQSQNKTILSRFKAKVDALKSTSDFEKSRNNLIRLVINSMETNPEQWDENCQINITWIGNDFINRLADEEKELSKERLDDIASMCFRFLFELYLSIKNDLSMEFEKARQFAITDIDQFEHSAKEQIQYCIRDMPTAIFKSIVNSDAISNIKDFNLTANNAVKLKSEWEDDLGQREGRVNDLRDNLSKYKTAFNFVGLYQGFDELAIEKTKEKEALQEN